MITARPRRTAVRAALAMPLVVALLGTAAMSSTTVTVSSDGSETVSVAGGKGGRSWR